MRFIPTWIHGVLDYVVSAVLIGSPWLFGFSEAYTASYVPVAFGLTTILYSFFTKYELGAIKAISMSAHLTLDLISGVMLACSPWLFGFYKVVYLPHLLIGVLEICVSLLTNPFPKGKRSRNLVMQGYDR